METQEEVKKILEKKRSEREALQKRLSQQKKRIVEKQQILKDLRYLKQMKEQVAANRNYANQKVLAQKINAQRDSSVKNFNAQQELKKHNEARFTKSPDGRIVTKEMSIGQWSEYRKESLRLQKEYRESVYEQHMSQNTEWIEKHLEENHRSDWNKKDYVSPEKQAEFDKARDALREKAGLEKKSGHVDIFQAQKLAQENNKVKEQQKQKVQSR